VAGWRLVAREARRRGASARASDSPILRAKRAVGDRGRSPRPAFRACAKHRWLPTRFSGSSREEGAVTRRRGGRGWRGSERHAPSGGAASRWTLRPLACGRAWHRMCAMSDCCVSKRRHRRRALRGCAGGRALERGAYAARAHRRRGGAALGDEGDRGDSPSSWRAAGRSSTQQAGPRSRAITWRPARRPEGGVCPARVVAGSRRAQERGS